MRKNRESGNRFAGEKEDISQNGGSRNADGNVLNAYLNNDGKFNMNYYSLDNSNSKYGIRREVFHLIPTSVGICVSVYFNQPFIILDISCKFSSIFK